LENEIKIVKAIGKETESEKKKIAAQDQVSQTKYHATKLLQTETDTKCRLSTI